MDRISKLRGSDSLRRKAGNKTPRSITLIVCEGETERDYFEAARRKYGLTTAEVIVPENTKGSAPISVVRFAENKCEKDGGYDQIFCVFDRNGHESYDRARNKIKDLKYRNKKPLPIEEAISVPCFELWILLHFEQTDRCFAKCEDVESHIRNKRIPDYRKAHPPTANLLMGKLDVALKNAHWLEKRAKSNGFCPYTSVHHVIRHFKGVAKKANST